MFGFQDFASLKRAFLAPFLPAKAQPASRPTPRVPIPADGELFQLTLDAGQADPMAMVRGDGYNSMRWRFNGTALKGTHTGQFKLVRLGSVNNLADARAKAHAMSVTLAEGQWREAFKLAYPHNDQSGHIAFGGETSGWGSPGSRRLFPVLHGGGESWDSDFRWSDSICSDDRWRWLVREHPST